MAKQKPEVNKSALVQEILKTNPKTPVKEIVSTRVASADALMPAPRVNERTSDSARTQETPGLAELFSSTVNLSVIVASQLLIQVAV